MKNGTASTSERSRHINIRYFFIKDVIIREGIDIEYCPTEAMIADFYTKALQGKLYRIMRDFIMGHASNLGEERVRKSVSKKCAPKSESSKLNESCKNDVEVEDSHENIKICPNDINTNMKDSPNELEPQDENKVNGNGKMTYAQAVMRKSKMSQRRTNVVDCR